MNSIIWKGIPSTDIQGLLICELPPITKPEMRTRETEIDGKDGSIIEELGYAPYTKTMKIGLHSIYNIDKVIKYFTGEGDVIFSNEPDRVYHARISDQIDFTRLLRYRQATVKFTVQPYKYKRNEYMVETQTATASGTNIVLSDSADANLKGLKIYGKSTQNGTPTPSTPVDIVSVGDDKNITVSINTANLIPYPYKDASPRVSNGMTFVVQGDGGVTMSGTPTANASFTLYKGNLITSGVATISMSGNAVNAQLEVILYNAENTTIAYFSTGEKSYTINFANYPTAVILQIAVKRTKDNVATSGTVYVQCEIGETLTRHMRYSKQTVTLSTPLRAIPVTDAALATYTDAIGQMWHADEIDLERGIYVQRVGVVESYAGESVAEPYMSTTGQLTNGAKVIYALDKATETSLTAEQIEMCKALKSYEPTTTIQNDEEAYMSAEYIKPFEIFNEGYEESKPLMVLKGSGTVTVSVNGQYTFAYTFPEGENEVYIDSEAEDAYLGDTLKNRNMNGDFPVLIPATNKITWSGDVESIAILPRSRWL